MTKKTVIKLEPPTITTPQDLPDELKPLPQIKGDWKELGREGYHGKHSYYGEIDWNSKFFDDIYKNFKNNLLGREITFNYNHSGLNPAALKVIDLKKVKDEATGRTIGLDYLPLYTPSGYKKIQEGEFLYVSLEYQDDYEGKGTCLIGGTCTTDPFVTGNGLIKLENTNQKTESEVNTMNEAEIKAMQEKIKELEAEKASQVVKLEAEKESQAKKLEAEKKADEEKIKKLEAERKTEQDRIKKLEAEKRDLNLKFYKNKWMNEGVMVPQISEVETEYRKYAEAPIKLERTGEEFDVLGFADRIFSKLEKGDKVPLTQEGPEAKKLERPANEKTKTDVNKEQDEYTESLCALAEKRNPKA